MKQPKWSQIAALCQAVEAVAGGDIRCWVEHAGDVVAGERPDRLITPSVQNASGSRGAEVLACVSGRDSRVWIDLLAAVVRNDLNQQCTIHDMAAATARAWRQMNSLLAMASSSSLGVEAGKTIQRIFDMLVRATRLDGGVAVVRVPGSDDCLQLDATGVQRLPQDIVDGLEEVGSDVYTFLHDGEPDALRRACCLLLEPYQPAAVTRLQTENESYGWLLAAAAEEVSSDDLKLFGAAARLIAVALENSQTLTLERAATRAEVERELYQALAKTAPVGMFRTDAGGRVLYVNDRWCRVTGANEADALRDGWVCAVHSEDRVRVLGEWERLLVEGAPFRCEHRCRRTDREIWVLTEIAREAREDGGFVGTLTDISDRKRAEQEKAELEEHLRHAHKMEAVGTMAGGIAHDFNNILGAIVSNAELAVERVPEGDRGRVHLDRLLKGAFRARELIGQLLAFSRQTQRIRVAQDVGPVVTEAVDLIRASIPAVIELQVEISAPAARVSADAAQLHQVILNLCRNACDAIGDAAGTIRVELDRCEPDGQASARLGAGVAPGRYVRLRVTDNGPGVSEDVRERIFEPFFTTKATCGGSGMGLAMVHGIVADHGGFVQVSDAPGHGARFDVYLPELCGDEAAAALPDLPVTDEIDDTACFASAGGGSVLSVADSGAEDGSLEDLVAAFLADERQEDPALPLRDAPATDVAAFGSGHVGGPATGTSLVRGDAALELARLRARTSAQEHVASGAPWPPGSPASLPGPERATAPDTPSSGEAGHPGSNTGDSLLERLVAEFLAEDPERAPSEGTDPATGGCELLAGFDPECAMQNTPYAGATVPAVRPAGVPAKARLIERAPEFRPGHARLLGSGRSRSSLRELPSGAAHGLPSPTPASPEPEPGDDRVSSGFESNPPADAGETGESSTCGQQLPDTAPPLVLPFPYGLPQA